jgi:hypothetical protein
MDVLERAGSTDFNCVIELLVDLSRLAKTLIFYLSRFNFPINNIKLISFELTLRELANYFIILQFQRSPESHDTSFAPHR